MPTPADSAPAAPAPSWARDLLLLALLAGALNFLLLGRLPLANPDESRYAGIPREMLARDDWVVPHLNGIPYFEKPPLVYWTVGLSRVLFGPGEFAARLTPALFGLGGVLLAYTAGRRLYGRRAGWCAAGVLATCLLHFTLSRVLLLDMPVAMLMAATLVCFLAGVHEPPGPRRRALFLGLYAAAALATLAKGLIGFLIPGAVMFLWLLLLGEWRRLRPLHLPSGAALFLLIAAPWHLLAAQRHDGWARFYFIREHWERFTTDTHLRGEPWWFFGVVLLAGLFPWVGFLVPAVRSALAGGWARRREHAAGWFLVLWVAFIVLFFSLSRSKLIPYILPVYPALAVLVGGWLARRWEVGEVAPLRTGLRIGAAGYLLLAVALVVLAFRPGLVRGASQVAGLPPLALSLAVALGLGAAAIAWAVARRGVAAGLGALGGVTVLFLVTVVVAAPVFQRAGTRALAVAARALVRPADEVFHYWAFYHDFVYYSGREVGLVSYVDELQVQFLDPAERARRFIDEAELRRRWAGPGRVWVVIRRRELDHPQSAFAAGGLTYHTLANTPVHALISNQP